MSAKELHQIRLAGEPCRLEALAAVVIERKERHLRAVVIEDRIKPAVDHQLVVNYCAGGRGSIDRHEPVQPQRRQADSRPGGIAVI